MILFLIILYILCGAGVGSVYYYLQIKRSHWDDDIMVPVLVGAFWLIAAPFAFGFYYARRLAERSDKE